LAEQSITIISNKTMFEKLKKSAIVLVWIIIAALATTTLLRECSGTATRVITVRDTLRLVSEPITITRDSIRPVYQYLVRDHWMNAGAVHDTTWIRTIDEREAMRERLEAGGVRELMTLDTMVRLSLLWNSQALQVPVMINDTADCIGRRITCMVRFKDTTYALEKQVTVPISNPSYSLGIGIGYGLAPGGRLFPTLGVSLTRILISY
jgi:hypothetical protein